MSETPNGDKQFRVASLTRTVYLPGILFAIGQGRGHSGYRPGRPRPGASPAVAGAIVALRGIGTLFFDLPRGQLVARVGERWAMLIATAGLGRRRARDRVGGSSLAVFAVLAFLMGAPGRYGAGALSYATEATPLGIGAGSCRWSGNDANRSVHWPADWWPPHHPVRARSACSLCRRSLRWRRRSRSGSPPSPSGPQRWRRRPVRASGEHAQPSTAGHWGRRVWWR